MRIMALCLFLASGADGAEPVVNLESTVTGNQEQPKVLYIVPWKAPDGPDSLYQNFNSQLETLFEPVERDSFVREMNMNQRMDDSAANQNPVE